MQGLCIRLATVWLLAALAILLAGCATIKPLKPGGASVGLRSDAGTNWYQFTQSENPGTASEQQIERVTEEEITYQEGQFSVFSFQPEEAGGLAGTSGAPVARPYQPHANTSAQPYLSATNPPARPYRTEAAPRTVKRKTTERVGTTIGAAQKDTARDLSARLKNMRAVQIAGIGLVIAACVLLYFKWPTPAAIAGIGGVGMIVLAQVLPGNEALILFIGCGVVIGGIALVLYAWNKGKLDQYLPDSLDKIKPQ